MLTVYVVIVFATGRRQKLHTVDDAVDAHAV